ncbi:MAG: hypothetical protein K0Q90_2414 [Paenibacillaceae bacterium]|nr:hypothetical protein [Paenibacillaceae bacterium]
MPAPQAYHHLGLILGCEQLGAQSLAAVIIIFAAVAFITISGKKKKGRSFSFAPIFAKRPIPGSAMTDCVVLLPST